MELFIGIDPGVAGGIAVVDATGAVRLAVKMPETEREILDVLKEPGPGYTVRAVLERVRASPKMGVTGAFTFGRGYGALRMALTARGIPFDEVIPQRWQKALGCLTGGDKNVSKRRAQDFFPSVKVTHALADALLLAEFARRSEMGGSIEPSPVELERLIKSFKTDSF